MWSWQTLQDVEFVNFNSENFNMNLENIIQGDVVFGLSKMVAEMCVFFDKCHPDHKGRKGLRVKVKPQGPHLCKHVCSVKRKSWCLLTTCTLPRAPARTPGHGMFELCAGHRDILVSGILETGEVWWLCPWD